MCKSKSSVAASDPGPRSRSRSSSATISAVATTSGGFGTGSSGDPRQPRAPVFPFNSFPSSASKASSSSGSSLSSLREALPEALVLYTFPELRSATGDFRSNCLPGTSSGWRCSLRGKDAVVFQRRFRGPDPAALPSRLAALARSHHSSLVPLLGASIVGDHIYIVHEFAPGATLDDCLRNPRNPSFTPLSTWILRMQVASDLAHGLEYIHLHSSVTAGVHNRLKSSSVIVTDPGFRARICHFGAADLAGDTPAAAEENGNAESDPSTSRIRRTGSRRMRIEGSRDYMAPELFTGGSISRRSDVFALGVVLLELISGEKPVERRGSDRVSLINTAREAIGAEQEENRRGRVRQWVDRRLRDSFPVDAAEALIQVALLCVEADPAARPDMTWVVGRVSMLFLDSKAWADAVKHPTDISVSFAPRTNTIWIPVDFCCFSVPPFDLIDAREVFFFFSSSSDAAEFAVQFRAFMEHHRGFQLPPPPPPPPSPSSSDASFPVLAISILGILITSILLLSYYVFAVRCRLSWRHSDVVARLSRPRPRSRRFLGGDWQAYPTAASESRGLGAAEIRAIPTFRYLYGGVGTRAASSGSHECAVCLSEFQEQERIRLLPDCFHAFHIDCIDTWLQTNANCPLCRATITPAATAVPIDQLMASVAHRIDVRDDDGGAQQSEAVVAAAGVPVKGRKVHRHRSFGDECIDARSKGGRQLSVQPMRRSFSVGSSSDRQLLMAVQKILQQNQHFRDAGEGSSNPSSGRIRRALFSFHRHSRSAVLPVEIEQ